MKKSIKKKIWKKQKKWINIFAKQFIFIKNQHENNRKIAQKYFSGDLGILRAGALADVIVVDYDPLTPMNENNINSHILFGFTGKDVVTTIIDGKVIMQDRKLVGINEKEIFKTSREVAKKLWDRM